MRANQTRPIQQTETFLFQQRIAAQVGFKFKSMSYRLLSRCSATQLPRQLNGWTISGQYKATVTSLTQLDEQEMNRTFIFHGNRDVQSCCIALLRFRCNSSTVHAEMVSWYTSVHIRTCTVHVTHYILFTYFPKLLKLRFLTQYILLTYFSKLLKLIF